MYAAHLHEFQISISPEYCLLSELHIYRGQVILKVKPIEPKQLANSFLSEIQNPLIYM